MKKITLHLPIGLPGSGKTTRMCQILNSTPNSYFISFDILRKKIFAKFPRNMTHQQKYEASHKKMNAAV